MRKKEIVFSCGRSNGYIVDLEGETTYVGHRIEDVVRILKEHFIDIGYKKISMNVRGENVTQSTFNAFESELRRTLC